MLDLALYHLLASISDFPNITIPQRRQLSSGKVKFFLPEFQTTGLKDADIVAASCFGIRYGRRVPNGTGKVP